jgi:hypothetical protein
MIKMAQFSDLVVHCCAVRKWGLAVWKRIKGFSSMSLCWGIADEGITWSM